MKLYLKDTIYLEPVTGKEQQSKVQNKVSFEA